MSKTLNTILLIGTIVLGGLLWMTLRARFAPAGNDGNGGSGTEAAVAPVGASRRPVDAIRRSLESKSDGERVTKETTKTARIVNAQTRDIAAAALPANESRISGTANSARADGRATMARTSGRGMLSGTVAARASLAITPDRIERQYLDYFTTAGMDEDSANKIRGVVLEYRQKQIATDQLNDAERPQAITENWAEYQKNLHEILSPERVEEFNAYSKSIGFKPIAEATAKKCAAGGIEMSPNEVQALAMALSKMDNSLALLLPATLSKGDTAMQVQQRAFTAAESVLSQSQLEVFKQTVAAQTNIVVQRP